MCDARYLLYRDENGEPVFVRCEVDHLKPKTTHRGKVPDPTRVAGVEEVTWA